jgi:hypothetical protein
LLVLFLKDTRERGILLLTIYHRLMLGVSTIFAFQPGTYPNRCISSQEFGIPVSAANAVLGQSVDTKADPDRVKKLLPVSPLLMARYNREELYEKVWRLR